jgi:hypothetical protein
MRYVILLHRYLGIGLGVLMVAWSVSGIVMMYVAYPALSSGERLVHLEPLDWEACCVVGDESLPDDARVDSVEVEMLTGRPVLRVKLTRGGWRLIDLIDGHTLAGLTARQAEGVAAAFDRAAEPGGAADYRARPRLDSVVDYDQWTVSGEFDSARPLYRFALGDAVGTQLYVSRATGRVVQVTSARERFWNWVGAIPHWLYFAQLRRNTPVWSQVLIGTSLGGCFLTVVGIYLGLRQFLRRPAGRWSPYRGSMLWHHVPGLMFGLVTLAWVGSGLLSMNPWGWLESASGQAAARGLRGAPITGEQVKASVRALATAPLLPEIVSVESAPLWGRLYLVLTTRNGARWRLDASGGSARIGSDDWAKLAQTLSGGGRERAVVPELITEGDAYYFNRPGSAAMLPIYRIVLHDEQKTRYYLDPLSGALLATIDSNGRWYRWLHQGLHTLDFSAALRARPGWDLLMLTLLAGVTVSCATGAYLGLRRCLPR